MLKKNKKCKRTNKQQTTKIVCWAKISSRRMVPDFATKMLPLKNMRNNDLSWGKTQQKTCEDTKNELCANPFVQPYSLQKEATVTADASEKTTCGVPSQEGHPVINDSSRAKILEHRAGSTGTRLKQFLLGRRFTLQTDHKPLKYLFAPDKEIP